MTTTLNKLIKERPSQLVLDIREAIIEEYNEHETCGYDIGCIVTSKTLTDKLDKILSQSIQSGYELGQQNPIIEKCPNCIEPDENIEPMPDGSCGVCGGKGYIIWKRIGKLQSLLKGEK
jgi:hypothetical protein